MLRLDIVSIKPQCHVLMELIITRKYFIEDMALFYDANLVYLLDLYKYSNAL